MIQGQYFQGPPHAIAEVLSPPSRALDRGPRRDCYHRAGVPHYWIVDPDLETIEVYSQARAHYQLDHTYRAGDSFAPSWCPEEIVRVDDVFETQSKRDQEGYWRNRPSTRVGILKIGEVHELPERVPAWLCDSKVRLGLEHLFLLGHPDRRSEIWNNRAHCVLAFGSAEEARLRFTHFLEDVCRWEDTPMPKRSSPAADWEEAECGRFRLQRHGRRVQLEVAVDGQKFRRLLEVWTHPEAWDWGEKSGRKGTLGRPGKKGTA